VDGLQPLGWSLVVLGAVLAVIGVVILLGPRIPILGHLPGDIVIQRDSVTIIIPLGTMVVVSIVVSVVLALLSRR
jgi:membrane associated rhomboid family serine protease